MSPTGCRYLKHRKEIGMPMRDYFPLDKIEIPEAQEIIMDIMCEAWWECQESECVRGDEE